MNVIVMKDRIKERLDKYLVRLFYGYDRIKIKDNCKIIYERRKESGIYRYHCIN